MSRIPSIGNIKIADAPRISPIELIQQVLENINGQISALVGEVESSNQSGDSEITELMDHIQQIHFHSEKANSLLNEVVSDQTKFSTMLQQLTGNCETHRRMENIVESVKELEHELTACEYDYYRIVAEILIDVKHQLSPFDAYGATPQFKAIRAKVNAIETELQRQVQWSFREIGQLVPAESDINPNGKSPELNLDEQNLSQIRYVVSALGSNIRVDLLERFSQLQLIPYEKAFRVGTPHCGIEYLEKRFIWFRYLLAVTQEKVDFIFPSQWNLPYYYFLEFSRRTKKQMYAVLEALDRGKPGPERTVDRKSYVATLIGALRKISAFETEIRSKFDFVQREGQMDDDDPALQVARDATARAKDSIADAFDEFLDPFVQLERERLESLLHKLLGEEDDMIARPTADFVNKGPYPSASQLFVFIKDSLKNCMVFSRGLTYLALSKEFRICMHNYAESLKFRCPSPVLAKAGKPPVYVLNASDHVTLARVIATAEYCIDVLPPLQDRMKERIQPQYAQDVDFTDQIDAFSDTIAFTMNVLLSAVSEKLLDGPLRTMRKHSWSSVDRIGDHSPYVREVAMIFNGLIPTLREQLSNVSLNQYCMKQSSSFLDLYLENIWKLKRISKTGAGQLLLDVNGLNDILSRLPQLNFRPDSGVDLPTVSKVYMNLLSAKLQKIESILKLVSIDDGIVQEAFQSLWPDGDPADLERVLALKSKGQFMDAIDTSPLNKIGDAISDSKAAKAMTMHTKILTNGMKSSLEAVFTTGNIFDDPNAKESLSRRSSTATPSPAPSDSKSLFSTLGLKNTVSSSTIRTPHGPTPPRPPSPSRRPEGVGVGLNDAELLALVQSIYRLVGDQQKCDSAPSLITKFGPGIIEKLRNKYPDQVSSALCDPRFRKYSPQSS